jgi:5-methylcytosine-specific restriction enzyme subunit McrC
VPVGEGGFTRGHADFLLAAARRHPIGGREGTDILCDHHRHLTARQAVGVVAGRGCSLEILPKLDPAAPDEAAETVRGRLVHMLDVALGLGLSPGEPAAMAHRAESLLDIFIALFVDRLLAEVRRGLPRQYRAREDDLRALRGRLNVKRQFTVHAIRSDRLACRFDELASDTALMRVMKACVLLCARHARAAATHRKLAELRFLRRGSCGGARCGSIGPAAGGKLCSSWRDCCLARDGSRRMPRRVSRRGSAYSSQ